MAWGILKNKAKQTVNKHPTIENESIIYNNGNNKPINLKAYETWANQVSTLNTALGTTGDLASSAKLKFYKKDSKGNLKLTNFKYIDTDFMNAEQDLPSWLYQYFTTKKLYNNVLIVPEESGRKQRKGIVDFYIMDNVKWKIDPDKTGTTAIDTFIYTTSKGDITYNYDDVIYISKQLGTSNLLYGISKLQSLNNEVLRILSMGKFVDNFVSSGGKKAVIAGHETPMNENTATEVKQAINKYLKDPNQKVLLLNTEKLSIKEVSDSLAGNDIASFMVKLNKTVFEAFNMPKWLIGDYEGSTNSETVRLGLRVYFQTAIKPEFLSLEKHLTRYITDNLKAKNIIAKFDYDDIDILEDSATEAFEVSSGLFKLGGLSVNELRIKNGLEPIDNPNFDFHFAPAYLMSGQPVRYEKFEEDVAQNILSSNTNSVPSGEGGQDNTEDENGAD